MTRYCELMQRHLAANAAIWLEPETAREALRPLTCFLEGGSALETGDSLSPGWPPAKVPRGRIQMFFKDQARHCGWTVAMQLLTRFAMLVDRRIDDSFVWFLAHLILRNDGKLGLEEEKRFFRYMWDNTGDFLFQLEYCRALLKSRRSEEFETAVAQAMEEAVSLSDALSLVSLHLLGGSWERSADYLQKLQRRSEVGAYGLFRLLEHRTQMSLKSSTTLVSGLSAFMLTLNPASPRYSCCSFLMQKTGLRLQPFIGLNGRRVPYDLVGEFAVKGPYAPGPAWSDRGHLGCSISHLALLEHFLSGHDQFALILEEDAIPYFKFDLNDLAPILENRPDIIYCNHRRSLVNLPRNVQAYRPGKVPQSFEVQRLLTDDYEAYGADGYIISRRGAEKLLEAHRIDGLIDFWDVQMLAYGLQKPVWHPHWWKQRVNRTWRDINETSGGSRILIDSCCLELPMVIESGFFNSETSAVRSGDAFLQPPADEAPDER